MPAAILIRADGWPVGTTDEQGRYRVPAGAYQVLETDGGLDGVELNGGAAELNARAPQPVAVTLAGVGSGRDELPTVAVVHWSSSGVPLAFNRGRPESATFLVGTGPGASRTTVLAERFDPLQIIWSAPARGGVVGAPAEALRCCPGCGRRPCRGRAGRGIRLRSHGRAGRSERWGRGVSRGGRGADGSEVARC